MSSTSKSMNYVLQYLFAIVTRSLIKPRAPPKFKLVFHSHTRAVIIYGKWYTHYRESRHKQTSYVYVALKRPLTNDM